MNAPRPRLDWIPIACFVVSALFLSVTWGSAVSGRGLLKNPRNARIMASVAQVSVLVAAGLTIQLFSGGSFRRIGWRLGPGRAYLGGLLGIFGVVGATAAVSLELGSLRFAENVRPAQVAVNVPVLWVLTCLFSFAEEFGWRGFLLPKLLPLGVKRALLWSSLAWFVWEVPLVCYGLLDGTLFALNAPLTLLCHGLKTFGFGIVFGYLRLRYDSIFLPTFAHGTLNALGGLAALLCVETLPLWGDFGGPIGTLLVVAGAGWVWWRLDQEVALFIRPETGETEDALRADASKFLSS